VEPTVPSALESSGVLVMLAVSLRRRLCKSGAAAHAFR